MKYKERLLELILDEDDNAMIAWIESQPLLEQPDIFRELKELAEEISAENGDDIHEMIPGFDTFEAGINNYEDKILDEKLAEANYVMALEEQERIGKEIDEAVEGVRAYVIECIVTNAPNATAMRALAEKMIEMEMNSGTYNPENWISIQ